MKKEGAKNIFAYFVD